MKAPKTKGPQNIPQVGDDCRLRGRAPRGKLAAVNDSTLWARVEWAEDAKGPVLVHLHELERLDSNERN